MPRDSRVPSSPRRAGPDGRWLAIGVCVLLAVANALVVVVSGQLWGAAVVVVTVVAAVVLYREMRANPRA